MTDTSPTDEEQQSKIDTTVAHSARIWNYWLGGKDNFAVDRQVGDQVLEIFPDIGYLARSVRAFLVRVVTSLTDEVGIRQFLDIGTGLPTFNNTHEVAQAIAPECRIVYVDNDPLVLTHARALLSSTPQGPTDYIDADARDTDEILQRAARTLDFTQPVAITMLGFLGHVLDDDEANTIVNRLLDAVPSGSYLAITDPTHSDSMDALLEHWNRFGEPKMTARSPDQIAGFFDRLELVEPGMVPVSQWRPDLGDVTIEGGPRDEADPLGAVGRKPR
ncbi:MAG: SAM-dependent methyltransferase [Jiangellaceae bacterium]